VILSEWVALLTVWVALRIVTAWGKEDIIKKISSFPQAAKRWLVDIISKVSTVVFLARQFIVEVQFL
jgi:hypothetical protein